MTHLRLICKIESKDVFQRKGVQSVPSGPKAPELLERIGVTKPVYDLELLGVQRR